MPDDLAWVAKIEAETTSFFAESSKWNIDAPSHQKIERLCRAVRVLWRELEQQTNTGNAVWLCKAARKAMSEVREMGKETP